MVSGGVLFLEWIRRFMTKVANGLNIIKKMTSYDVFRISKRIIAQ